MQCNKVRKVVVWGQKFGYIPRRLQVEQAEAAASFGLLASVELRLDTHHLSNITDVEQKDLHN